jgi:integrase/recombinase XerC
MEATALTAIVNEYASHLQAEKGLAAPTRERYVALARGLLALCASEANALFLPDDWELQHVDRRVVETFLNTLKEERGWKPMSVAYYITSLSAFFRFLKARHHISVNPCARLRPRLDGGLGSPPEGATKAVLKMLDAEADTLDGARRALLIELLYGASLKPSQAYGVTALEPDAAQARVRLRIGDTWSVHSLSLAGIARAERYLALRGEVLPSQGENDAPVEPAPDSDAESDAARPTPFWLDRRGRACSPQRLARQVTRAMQAVGLTGGPASLRVLAAKHFGEQGADIRSVQQLLGARRLGQLDRFQPPSDLKHLMTQFRRAHPRQGR